MLIDFAITNFRSIKERQVFSMQTVSRISEKPENTIQTNNEQLLSSAVIYGVAGIVTSGYVAVLIATIIGALIGAVMSTPKQTRRAGTI